MVKSFWRQLDKLGTGVKLEKLSPVTIAADLEPAGISYLMGGKTLSQLTNAEKHTPIGSSLWRCRVGKYGSWHYARSPDSAAIGACNAHLQT